MVWADILERTYNDQKKTIEEQNKTIEDQKKMIEDQKKMIKSLESDNCVMKYFLDEVFRCHIQYVRVNGSDTYLKIRGAKGKEKSWSSLGADYWECFVPGELVFVEEEKKRK